MVNTHIFQSIRGALLPVADATNASQAPAYAYTPRHQLAQLAATGCLGHTFHADAEAQLDAVLALAAQVEPQFVAKVALHAREAGHMKDMPALLAATLAVRDVALLGAGVRPRRGQRQDAARVRADPAQRRRGPQVARLASQEAGAAMADHGERVAAAAGLGGQHAVAGRRGEDGSSEAGRAVACRVVRVVDRQAGRRGRAAAADPGVRALQARQRPGPGRGRAGRAVPDADCTRAVGDCSGRRSRAPGPGRWCART